MKYHDKDQFIKIMRLQEEAIEAHRVFRGKLSEADELVEELRDEFGDAFVCDGQAYAINTASHGFTCTGTRYWVYHQPGVKEIK